MQSRDREKAERHEWVLIHMGFGVYIYGSILYILTITKQTRIHQREREGETREKNVERETQISERAQV